MFIQRFNYVAINFITIRVTVVFHSIYIFQNFSSLIIDLQIEYILFGALFLLSCFTLLSSPQSYHLDIFLLHWNIRWISMHKYEYKDNKRWCYKIVNKFMIKIFNWTNRFLFSRIETTWFSKQGNSWNCSTHTHTHTERERERELY